MTAGRTRLRSHLLLGSLLMVAISGCSMVLGGKDNPRPDPPDTTPPTAPDGAAAWSSLDWEPVTFERPEKTSGEQWDQPTAVAAGPGGWVAVGSNSDVMGYHARIWQTADSLTWHLVDSDRLAGLELVDVAATADAYIAVGTRSADPNDPRTSILHSTDGLSWFEAHAVRGAWASHVESGPGGFAVVIEVGETTEMLLSRDGRTWERVRAADIGKDLWIADVASDGPGWIVAGSVGDRAVVLRSADGRTWTEDPLPASEPVDGIMDVSAYRVIPGPWATLLLGIDRGPSCAENHDWCDQFQAAWSWTAEAGWARLPKANWLVEGAYGAEVHPAGDAGFVSLLGDVRTSADGWEWVDVDESSPSEAFPRGVVVTGDRMVAVGIPLGDPADGAGLTGWFGSAQIRR